MVDKRPENQMNTVYLVNYARRRCEKTTLPEALSLLHYLKKYEGYHMGDYTWSLSEGIQLLDSDSFHLLQKEWEAGGWEVAFKLLRKNFKLSWCCHADGYFERDKDGNQYCCDEHYFRDRVKELCSKAEFLYIKEDGVPSEFWKIYYAALEKLSDECSFTGL